MGKHRIDYWQAGPSLEVLDLWGDRRLTARWQYGLSRDHLALRLRCRTHLPNTVIAPSRQRRWDWRRLQVALEDYALREEFQNRVWQWSEQNEELANARADLSPEGVERHWHIVQEGIAEQAEMFIRPKTQRKPWTGKQTLQLIEQRKQLQEAFRATGLRNTRSMRPRSFIGSTCGGSVACTNE